MKLSYILTLIAMTFGLSLISQDLSPMIDSKVEQIEDKVVEWRRHLHQYPELSNREYTTADFVAKHLRDLGLQVETGIAHTGVVGLLDTGKPGPTVALRADMDGLPVRARVNLPFASKVESEYLGKKVGVMHACGHDGHTAVGMGVASLLAQHHQKIPV